MRLPQPAHSLVMQFVFGVADTADVLTPPGPLAFTDVLLLLLFCDGGIALCPIAAAAVVAVAPPVLFCCRLDTVLLPLIEFLLIAPNDDVPVAVPILFA